MQQGFRGRAYALVSWGGAVLLAAASLLWGAPAASAHAEDGTRPSARQAVDATTYEKRPSRHDDAALGANSDEELLTNDGDSNSWNKDQQTRKVARKFSRAEGKRTAASKDRKAGSMGGRHDKRNAGNPRRAGRPPSHVDVPVVVVRELPPALSRDEPTTPLPNPDAAARPVQAPDAAVPSRDGAAGPKKQRVSGPSRSAQRSAPVPLAAPTGPANKPLPPAAVAPPAEGADALLDIAAESTQGVDDAALALPAASSSRWYDNAVGTIAVLLGGIALGAGAHALWARRRATESTAGSAPPSG